jgi:copper transport protein
VPLASTIDAVHVAAASIWLGGLVVLGSVLLCRPGEAGTPADLDAVLPRWSRAAMCSVVALVVSGAYQAWRGVGGWDALMATAYGRLVLTKVTVLTVMLILAWHGRRWILRHLGPERVATARDSMGSLWSRRGRAVRRGGGPHDAGDAAGVRGPQGARTAATATTAADPRGGVLVRVSGPAKQKPVRLTTLRRSVVAEAALGGVVLALTAALVNAVPARQAYVPAFTTTLVARSLAGDTVRIDVAVRPTTPGYEGISLRASTPSGRALRLQDAVASFTNPARGIGPIELDLARGTGRVEDALISVPSPGVWRVTLRLRVNASIYSATTGYSVG